MNGNPQLLPIGDNLWEDILSRDQEIIRKAYLRVSRNDQTAIKNHLQEMCGESDWHPQQKMSAEIALSAINSIEKGR